MVPKSPFVGPARKLWLCVMGRQADWSPWIAPILNFFSRRSIRAPAQPLLQHFPTGFVTPLVRKIVHDQRYLNIRARTSPRQAFREVWSVMLRLGMRLALAAGRFCRGAQDMKPTHCSLTPVDWDAVRSSSARSIPRITYLPSDRLADSARKPASCFANTPRAHSRAAAFDTGSFPFLHEPLYGI